MKKEEELKKKIYKLILVGDENVGKTHILYKYLK